MGKVKLKSFSVIDSKGKEQQLCKLSNVYRPLPQSPERAE